MAADFLLPIPEGRSRLLTAGWLVLGLAALLIAGFLSILLVLSRTPYIQDVFPWIDFFHTALVVHVDLSVLIWFLSFAGVFWSINSVSKWSGLGLVALFLSAIGASIIAVSPFLGAGNPLMNNYIPVLQDPIFFMGLVIFTIGFTLLIGRSLFTFTFSIGPINGMRALQLGVLFSTAIALIAMLSFFWSYITIPDDIHGEWYYEILFWGGGHVLQFMHTLLMLVSWLWLFSIIGGRLSISARMAVVLFGIILMTVLITPAIYLSFDITSFEHKESFTLQMKYGMVLPVLPIALLVFWGIIRGGLRPDVLHLRAALVTSLLLFGVGGVIGFMIQGMDVTVPAHYHGAIVGVTLAYMGITYHLLPHLGFRKPLPRLSCIQPYIYGAGQFLNIIGLAWAGGYGVQRKTLGGAHGLESIKGTMSMVLMGFGGLVAIIGGFLFLAVVIHAIWPARKDTRGDYS